MPKEFETNPENGKTYEIKPTRYEQHPHLAELKKECETVRAGSSQYWKLRCNYLEKTIDNTYSIFERDNCREFYKILAKRE